MSYRGICDPSDKPCRRDEYKGRQAEWAATHNCVWDKTNKQMVCYICDKNNNICLEGKFDQAKADAEEEARKIAEKREQFKNDFIGKGDSGHEKIINGLNNAQVKRYK